MASEPSRVPPGFRFHPTDEELVNYYLRKKVNMEKFDLDVIRDVDLNKLEPWDLQERCRIDTAQQTEWYFFSHKDKKYPTGTRTNRATAAGFWKATGRDKAVHGTITTSTTTSSPTSSANSHVVVKRIGMRKTLVFYRGRAPHGQKTDWIMHEYRLEDYPNSSSYHLNNSNSSEDGWVVCRVFKKRMHHQKPTSQSNGSTMLISEEEQSSLVNDNTNQDQYNNLQTTTPTSIDEQTYFNCKTEDVDEEIMPQVPFLHMPQLESPRKTTHNNSIFNDILDFNTKRSLVSMDPFHCKKSDMFSSPFNTVDMPTLDVTSYKSHFFECAENLVDNDQWCILESLSKDIRSFVGSSTDNLCTNVLSSNCDTDIWKPLL